MRWTEVAAILVMALSGGTASAQYARPVEVAPARPVAPGPTIIAPSPGISAPTLSTPAPAISSPPAAVVPSPPPAVAEGGKPRPRKCWCYFVNPATNSRQRSTCDVSCCKGGHQDERC
jgi:hypothetical protein